MSRDVVRLNLCLSPGDYAVCKRVASFSRVPVGSWARMVVCQAASAECRRLIASGDLSDYEQIEAFTKPPRSVRGKGAK